MQSEKTSMSAPVHAVVMPQFPGWYLVEVTGLVHQPESGFAVDYCRVAAESDGVGMEWVNNYRHNVVAWHELPNRKQCAAHGGFLDATKVPWLSSITLGINGPQRKRFELWKTLRHYKQT